MSNAIVSSVGRVCTGATCTGGVAGSDGLIEPTGGDGRASGGWGMEWEKASGA